MQILIRWLHEKPSDLDLHCFLKRLKEDISRFSRFDHYIETVLLSTHMRKQKINFQLRTLIWRPVFSTGVGVVGIRLICKNMPTRLFLYITSGDV